MVISIGLLQDLSTTVSNPYALKPRYDEAGYPDGLGLPRTLRRKIAQELHSPYYLLGEFDRS